MAYKKVFETITYMTKCFEVPTNMDIIHMDLKKTSKLYI